MLKLRTRTIRALLRATESIFKKRRDFGGCAVVGRQGGRRQGDVRVWRGGEGDDGQAGVFRLLGLLLPAAEGR